MPKTVLVVEDDENLRSIYELALTHRGYRVITATQGAEGVHLARKHCPDLILLDIRMPVMSGWGAALYLRSDPQTSSIPICAMSAYQPDEEDQEVAERVAFEGYLLKPLSSGDVIRYVEDRIGPADLLP